mmetsp:Transcript_14425/g.47044  ORF Transcript_14425/g.47044 Transcript_14425/m.47044 type:complete len:370 (+) Transcript_14425:234-1343(+)|eukprot:CAMPEP_0118896804 /NCGR_PEP_ID=MMETSP1166-20130328/4491_1 /TAXON_ID=1104430 /ORGANISM="Chrysoreinhardia sp, Strain CCMP3193" /LENGTH=369 /DNA_ID=CAMNT_0006835863 /DNA_START=200 /DNA_END=1309 /DNA_ORIENTATION=-
MVLSFAAVVVVVLSTTRGARSFAPSEKQPTKKPRVSTAPRRLRSVKGMYISDGITECIGNTPLCRLKRIGSGNAEILLKLESMEPCNSVKDRIGLSMIAEAEQRGTIKPGVTTLVEPTSGNTGIALAMVAASKGYDLILTMPETMSMERRVMLRAFGAELILTPGKKGMSGAVRKAEQIVEVLGADKAFLLQQFNNPDNPKIHREQTGPEIWKQCDGRIDILLGGVGTGGTLTGCAQCLKPLNPKLKVVAVEPAESPVLSGGAAGPHKIQGIGAGFIPGNADTTLFDEVVPIDSFDAIDMAREMATQEGILCGISSGAAVLAATKVADRPENKGKRIVTIIPSFGERYLSTTLFSDVWDECQRMKVDKI